MRWLLVVRSAAPQESADGSSARLRRPCCSTAGAVDCCGRVGSALRRDPLRVWRNATVYRPPGRQTDGIFSPDEVIGVVSASRSLADVESRASERAATLSYLPSCAGEHARPREREEKGAGPRGEHRTSVIAEATNRPDTKEDETKREKLLDRPLQRRIDDRPGGRYLAIPSTALR